MPTTTPYAKLMVTVDGGSTLHGGVTTGTGHSIQLSAESTVGWGSNSASPAARWEITSYPSDAFNDVPTGWSRDFAHGPIYFIGNSSPPSFLTDTWGKYMFTLLVDGGVKNGRNSDDMVDTGTSVSVESAIGLRDLGFAEEGQWDTLKLWVGDFQHNLRIIDGLGGSLGLATPNAVAGVVASRGSSAETYFGFIGVGIGNLASAGTIRLRGAAGTAIKGRNAANTADLNWMSVDGADDLVVGDIANVGGLFLNAKSAGLIIITCGNTNALTLTSTLATFTGLNVSFSGGAILGQPRFEQPTDIKVMFVGDSITQGFSSGGSHVGGFRLPWWQMIRATRNDVDVIGFLHTYLDIDPTFVAYTGSPPLYAMQRWKHSGYSGKKIEDITSNYTSGNVAVSGQPDIIYLMIGTNNVAGGDSAATMETKYNTMLDQIHAVSPSALIICCHICPFVAGTTTGASLAAWNAVQTTFNAWLADTGAGPTATRGYCRYIDGNSTLSGTDFLTDGVHPNASGFTKIAQANFDHFDRMFPIRRGRPYPRAFRQRFLSSSLKLSTPSLDFVQWTNDPNKSPASADFAISFDYYPTSLPGTIGVLFQYGVPYTSGLLIAQTNAGLSVYLYGAGPPIIDGSTNTPLVANRWHHITLIGNRATGVVGLYVNALPVAMASSVPAWSGATNLNGFIGAAGGLNAAPGYFSNLRFYKGSGVPVNETKACIDSVEREYFDGGELCAGGTSFVQLNEGSGGTVGDVITGNVTGNLSSGGGATTGWQIQAHPWDPGF